MDHEGVFRVMSTFLRILIVQKGGEFGEVVEVVRQCSQVRQIYTQV